MSVYTTLTTAYFKQLCDAYQLGGYQAHQGITEGITNTIYQLTTDTGRFIVTIFEEITVSDLPFYLDLMNYLAEHKFPCQLVYKDKDGQSIQDFQHKPLIIVPYLPGNTVDNPTVTQMISVAEHLAILHSLTLHYPAKQINPRGGEWRDQVFNKIQSKLQPEDLQLLEQEVKFQQQDFDQNIPRSIIHADLFRDNVLFEDEQLSGVLDFYYACHGVCVLDLAITINDWCLVDDQLDKNRIEQFLAAYQNIRPLSDAELTALPKAFRLGALRFWLSRRHDKLFPTSGELTWCKDPDHFKNILLFHLGDLTNDFF